MKKITATATYEVEFECENWDSLYAQDHVHFVDQIVINGNEYYPTVELLSEEDVIKTTKEAGNEQ